MSTGFIDKEAIGDLNDRITSKQKGRWQILGTKVGQGGEEAETANINMSLKKLKWRKQSYIQGGQVLKMEDEECLSSAQKNSTER